MKKSPQLRWVPSVGSEALALLEPARGAVETPIRAEIFGATRFAQHGRSLGQAHPARVNARAAPFFPRLQDNIRVLREAHAYIALQESAGHHVSPAGDWLMDNFSVVMAQVKEIHDGLPRRYFRDLPVLVEAHLEGLPRVYGVAWAFVAHTDSAFDASLLAHFLNAYQKTRELTLGELWALPTTLRVVLIENLRRLSERLATAQAAYAWANQWCDGLCASSRSPITDVQAVMEVMRLRGVGRIFALQILQRLRTDTGTPAPGVSDSTLDAVRQAVAALCPEPASAQVQQQAEQAADDLSVRNAITSLRRLADTDWRQLIAGTSVLVRRMGASPLFQAEREDTQDASLHAIERLARRSGHSELAVADALLALMQSPPAPPPLATEAPAQPVAASPQEAPGYWLQGPGAPALHRALGLGRAMQWPWRVQWQPWALSAYMGTVVLGSLGLTAWFLAQQSGLQGSGGMWLAWALLAFWPASEAVMAVVNRLISESLPPQRLPRLALAEGIPLEHRVLVVIPCMLGDGAGVQALVRQLELHYLANREPQAQFALLSDFADASTPHTPGDAALLQTAQAALDALELRHSAAPLALGRRFLLLHRERRWSDSEQCWMGWERKRGKLEQLVQVLAADTAWPFMDLGACSRLARTTPYVVTLDSDTGLPPGALRALVGVAAHPLNHPRVDTARRRVVAGHGILQPRLTTPLPAPQAATPFHWLFAGQCGVDPYSAATSEVYQDVFGEGTFSGKGLLHVTAVHAVLSGRLPTGQILSHDLLEGSVARCGGVSDITLMEDAPLHADVASSRVHRWTRGDWQLWPVLLQWRRFGLRTIHGWKMLDNLRRSLVAPMSVLLLWASLASGAVSPWGALALVAAAFAAGPLLGAVAGLAPSHDDVALGRFFRLALADVARALGRACWNLATLLQQGLLLAHAIATALWRTTISRRGLLRWTTAASAQASVQHTLQGLARRHAPVALAALALWGGLWWVGTPWPLLATAVCLLWAGAALWIWAGSRPWKTACTSAPSVADRAYLQGVARDTWRLFERHVGAPSHHLPPDNVQTVPHMMVAQRTSPTNIGLYLLSVACARHFGWISTAELLQRCEATLATLATLQRHRGHFLNWYDTATLAPLPPAYVSSVDSGNLCGHLLALAGACTEAADAGPPTCDAAQAQRLHLLAVQCRRLAEAPEFGFLYDPCRRLLHIGYRVDEQQLDKGFYDLLASESRLASLWAIAKGDVPVAHWIALGRPFYAAGRQAGLRSWSGSMFEYLMPALVLDEPAGSALASAAHAAIHAQQRFGHERCVPWGLSESAYAATDHTLAYQYAPQGVARLALRRTPPDELVVAPYATLLAAMFAPGAAVANLRRLEQLQARADMGFIEALDFTPERQTAGSACTPVHAFMSHHQGMALVALANVLLDGAPRRWTMADARWEAVAPLLQERVPREVSRLPAPEPIPHCIRQPALAPAPAVRDIVPGQSALQPTLLMSNGRYSVALRANGAGWSRFAGADVSRWRDDALRDAYGTFFYLRRHTASGRAAPVSLTQHPAPDAQAHYQASFHSDHACLSARWSDLHTCCTVWVSPEDDIELRRVELHNTSAQTMTVDVVSMWEVSLLGSRTDEAHPAFANLFVSADWDGADQALYLVRKPHVDGQDAVHAVHFIAHTNQPLVRVRAQADRAAWLGRNRDAAHPRAHHGAAQPGAAQAHTGLDPVASLCIQITVPAHASVQTTFATAAATQRAALETLVDRYRQPSVIERSTLMSATFAQARQRDWALPGEERQALQTLSTVLALLHSRPEAPTGTATCELSCDRRTLWRFGLSGERPLIVVDIAALHGVRLVHALTQGLRLWTWGALACDVVILNAEPWSYLMPVQMQLLAQRDSYTADVAAAVPARTCGLQVLHLGDLAPLEQATLRRLARVRLSADGRPLSHHVAELVQWHDASLAERTGKSGAGLAPWVDAVAEQPPEGQFDSASGSFRFSVSATRRPSRPWINVLANPDFGAHISEAGAGYSWAGNSRLQQLTAWSNDPVADPGGENFYVQDLHTHEVWNLGAGAGCAETEYGVEHGRGTTTIRHRRGGVEISATWCVDAVQSLKQVRIVLCNLGPRVVHLRTIGTLEWLLGAQRTDRQSVDTAMQRLPGSASAPTDVLLATQCDAHGGWGGSTAFLVLHSDGPAGARLRDWTCDRRELFDARGQRVFPDRLGARAGPGLDPCAAASTSTTLQPGQIHGCVFLLGHAPTRAGALALAGVCLEQGVLAREAMVRQRWAALLDAVVVDTPDPLFNALTNHWLLYQTVACRLWARAGFYQAGGAFGFRDQLQDAMALAVTAPQLLRQQLRLAASRQFVEGDVQHWWHPPGGAGVRTRCSDDLLWLPYAAAHYVQVSGDAALLEESVPFLDGPPLPAGAQDAYYEPQVSAHEASVYEHCARAIDHSLAVGLHGLPLMGSGDWNDGMNHVGDQGRGESVWLGWFLCRLVEDFSPLAQARGDNQRVARWHSAAQGWRAALQGPAWDGQWFKRAFFDDGTALGTHSALECRIDLIAQAWSVLSGVAPPERQQMAMASVARWLVDDAHGLNRLLEPPLQQSVPHAGYIQAYPPGVRENGGQYAHAGVWKLMAQAQLGDADGAFRTFTQLSPAHRWADPQQSPAYGLEPYVMAADVYTHAPYVGRGGWSWYTGAAAWMHRAAIESICGLRVRAGSVCIVPGLPSHWPMATLTLRRNGRTHRFIVCNAQATTELEQALAQGAQRLQAGQWLVLPEAGDASSHVVLQARPHNPPASA